MSSFSSGQVLSGAKWNYHIPDEPLKGDGTHRSIVYKAEVIPKDATVDAPRWAFIKMPSPEHEVSAKELQREHDIYRLPSVESAASFRKLYDVSSDSMDTGKTDPRRIRYAAFEWLDITLRDVEYHPDIHTYALIGAVLKATLASCAILEDKKLVNTDIKPANILISGIGTDKITVKVGDLGSVSQADYGYHGQPFAMRAPEVWQVETCDEPAQVWAVAAMLLVWMKPALLGASGCPWWPFDEVWSIMKLIALFPAWDVPPAPPLKDNTRQEEFKTAKAWADDPELREFYPACLEDELRMLDTMAEIKDVLRLMFVVNPAERPSAADVLVSKEFSALEEALVRMK
ncbi:serine/threonine protein kinase [Blastomyces parvus]|uniref:Serine/threonine protein kinase n=1 Tax=Blastomyces parvus TaxID=2060905 RepID=A0A2B7X4P3_9EURO|nr:serine/threonine protein kinase [Blastomyces parvus]